MQNYLDLLTDVRDNGEIKNEARKNMPSTRSIFGRQLRFDLKETFPILTSKKIPFELIKTELLWFLNGNTNIKYLIDNNCNIWNEDAYNYYIKLCDKEDIPNRMTYDAFIETIRLNSYESLYNMSEYINDLDDDFKFPYNYTLGDCGAQYGHLWRNWNDSNIDQIANIIKTLKNEPFSRRHIITNWNPETLDDMALPACHSFVQFNVRKMSFDDRIKWVMNNLDIDLENLIITEMANNKDVTPHYYLDCNFYMRSIDLPLGGPFDISSYALLTNILGKILNYQPGELVFSMGDAHIYENQIKFIDEQVNRKPKKLPTIEFSENFDILVEKLNKDMITLSELFLLIDNDDFNLVGYESHPHIKYPFSSGIEN